MKSRDQHLRDENDRRLARLCVDAVGCTMAGTHKGRGGWVCAWHWYNPGAIAPPEEIRRPQKDWREQAREDWLARLSDEQRAALERKDGEGRKAYAKRMAEIARRLLRKATIQLTGRLPYDKERTANGQEVTQDRGRSLQAARKESEMVARSRGIHRRDERSGV